MTEHFRFGFTGYDPDRIPGYASTCPAGTSSGKAAEFQSGPVDTRFHAGNPWRFRKGQSGNARGRPRRPASDADLHAAVLDLRASLHAIQRRLRSPRDDRFEKFRAFFEYTGNAHRSALLAGYAPKTAKSKAYLLARRARKGMGDEV